MQMQKLLKRALLLSSILGSVPAQAYIDYLPNENLAKEIEGQTYRVLPKGEHYTLAMDADFFKPVFFPHALGEYYHGNGYWLTLRSQFKPVQNFDLDLKFNIVHSTSSMGISFQPVILAMAGLTYRCHLLGFDVAVRLSDINRQTLGTGLFIDDKETDGGYVLFKRDEFEGKVMIDGTGNFLVDGGVLALDTHFWNRLLGATILFQEKTYYDIPFIIGTIYSKHTYPNGLGYGVEVGKQQYASYAELAYLQYQTDLGDFHLNVKPQVRHYDYKILGDVPKHTAFGYIGFDQNDKPFTNTIDILSFGDDVTTYTGQLDLRYSPNSFYELFVETEAVFFDYYSEDSVRHFFYRTGAHFYPIHDRRDSIGITFGNKYLNALKVIGHNSDGSLSYDQSPPNKIDDSNKQLFFTQFFVMFDLNVKF